MKREHKEIFFNEIIIPSLPNDGFGSSIFDEGQLINTAYMTIPELTRLFRKQMKNNASKDLNDQKPKEVSNEVILVK